MANKPYIIRISSQKGGVGKTTVAVNLGVALATGSQAKVLLVDADTSNPSVGFHVGLDDVNIGYEEVINRKVDVQKATVTHLPSGMRVLPGTIHTKSYEPSASSVAHFMDRLEKSNYNFVIIDTAPGLSQIGSSHFIDEALIITTPEMSSCTSSIRLAKLLEGHKIKHNLLVNRFRNKGYEISMGEIDELYGNRAFGPIPEDEVVQIGVAQHIPTYLSNKGSGFSSAIKEVSRIYLAKQGFAYASRFGSSGLIGFIRRILGLR